MNILVVRHAIAEERDVFAKNNDNDDERPLTKRGIERMREGARGLSRLVEHIDVLAYSPLVRAHQTAEILAKAIKPSKQLELPELTPGTGAAAITDWLQQLAPQSAFCLVGHEPDLSELIAWLTCGRAAAYVDLKKGSACLLECPTTPARDSATLLWALTPRQLRLLGRD